MALATEAPKRFTIEALRSTERGLLATFRVRITASAKRCDSESSLPKTCEDHPNGSPKYAARSARSPMVTFAYIAEVLSADN